jgi:dihydroorotase
MGHELLIKDGRIIDPSQKMDMSGNILVRDGKIAEISSTEINTTGKEISIIDANGCIVCPGFIDLHCHLREPGFEEKETIATGTRAAARGGFTTVCCMPNTNPPLDNESAIDYVKRKADTEGAIRVLPIGCITKNRQGEELTEMNSLAEAGVMGFSDDGGPVTSSRIMFLAMQYSMLSGLPIIDHCEDRELSCDGVMNEGGVSTMLGLRGIPSAAEEIMVARDIALAELTGARLHIAHVSSRNSVQMIRQAKAKGINITAEVTPHHLLLTDERVMTNINSNKQFLEFDTNAKVNPPLRSLSDIHELVKGLNDGTIDAIATDHAPHALVDKMCEFGLAAFGISGLETALACLLGLVHNKSVDLNTLISAMSYKPATIIGNKFGVTGTLQKGSSADITIFNPNKEWKIDSKSFASKGKNTPFDGQMAKGKVIATIHKGKIAYKDEEINVEAS